MRTASIVSYSIVHVAAREFAHKTPYVVALLEREGQRFVSMVEGPLPDLPTLVGVEVLLEEKEGQRQAAFASTPRENSEDNATELLALAAFGVDIEAHLAAEEEAAFPEFHSLSLKASPTSFLAASLYASGLYDDEGTEEPT